MQRHAFYIVASSFLLLTNCSNNKGSSSLNEYNLKGDVVKVYENAYEAENKFGKWEIGNKRCYGVSSTFNKNGMLTEYLSYSSSNVIDAREVISYDDNNIRTEKYDSHGSLQFKLNQTLDSKHRIIKTEKYDAVGKLISTAFYEYENSNIVVCKQVDGKGKTESLWKNELDGNYIKLQLVYDTLGKIKYKIYQERNDNNDIINTKVTNVHDSVTSETKATYEYDEQSNWIKKTVYNSDGKVDTFVIRKIIYDDSAGNTLKAEELTGIWKDVEYNSYWIEFKKDGTYDDGRDDRIKDSGKWELNEDQRSLTLKSDNQGNSKKYFYSYEEYKLILSTINGKERTVFERR